VKPLDCVKHEILSAKLHSHDIQRVTADWFASYLTNRNKKFEIKSPNSPHNFFYVLGSLKHEVPQGFILGSLLCMIYINGLPKRISSSGE
jgi:hypothetical protein